jgi:prepilin-type processing-associated H-X9-DG protein
MLPIAVLLAVSPMAAPAQGDLRELLYRDGAPTKVKDLGPGWWSVAITRSTSGSPGGIGAMASGGSDQTPLVVFTRGEILNVGALKLLVTYRISQPATDYVGMMKFFDDPGRGAAPKSFSDVMEMIAPAPTPESELLTELVDMSSIASLQPLGAFDTARIPRNAVQMSAMAIQAAVLFPVFAQARAKARATSSISNLKQIALGMLMYAQDYDERLPPMASLPQLKKAIYPYTKNEQLFQCPIPGSAYTTNPAASKLPAAAIESPAQFILVYESKPDSSGTRGIAFADGHVQRVRETAWAEVWERGKAPYRGWRPGP